MAPVTVIPPKAPKRAPAPVPVAAAVAAPAPQKPIERELQNLWAFRRWEAAGRCVAPALP